MSKNARSAPTRTAVSWLALGLTFVPSITTLSLQLSGVQLYAMGNLRNSIIVCNSLCVLLGFVIAAVTYRKTAIQHRALARMALLLTGSAALLTLIATAILAVNFFLLTR
ncbi:MAG: hypothetical protein M3036_01635 [Bifidobacteriales bacterium]|nr:hypothetical protein [Bifidobacteriales bacterium]